MSNLILCHGFNVNDAGKSTIDKLLPHLPLSSIQQADYGYFHLLGVRYFNDNIASVIAGMAADNSIAIGHSNGCAILVNAARLSPKIKRLILINPALDVDTKFPDTLERIDVFHNSYDFVVKQAKWFLFHPWGEMGRLGYLGADHRVTNHETSVLFGVSGHSAVLHHAAKELVHYCRTTEILV